LKNLPPSVSKSVFIIEGCIGLHNFFIEHDAESEARETPANDDDWCQINTTIDQSGNLNTNVRIDRDGAYELPTRQLRNSHAGGSKKRDALRNILVEANVFRPSETGRIQNYSI